MIDLPSGNSGNARKAWRSRLKDLIHTENEYVRIILSEFFGTFVLVYMVITTVMSSNFKRMRPDGSLGSPPSVLHLAYGCGVGVMLGLLVSGASGSHVNPAITGGFAVLGRCSWRKVPFYWFGQYAGGLIAACVAYILYEDAINKYGGGARTVSGPNATASLFATYPSGDHISWLTAFVDQIIAASFMMLGTLAMMDQKNWGIPKAASPFFAFFLVCAIATTMGHNCGAAINPARDLMPRLFTYWAGWGIETFSYWNYTWFWIPIVGSHLGCVVGAAIYNMFVGAQDPVDPAALKRGKSSVVELKDLEALGQGPSRQERIGSTQETEQLLAREGTTKPVVTFQTT